MKFSSRYKVLNAYRTYKTTDVTAAPASLLLTLFRCVAIDRDIAVTPGAMAQVFNIFADDRIDHSKMVKQLLLNQNPPLARAKSNPRPASGNHNGATKPHATKPKGNKVAVQQIKEEINKTTRFDSSCGYSGVYYLVVTTHIHFVQSQGRLNFGTPRDEAKVSCPGRNICTFTS